MVQFSAERGREQDHVEPPLGPEMKDRPPLIVLVLHQFCFFRRHKRRPTKDLDPVSPIKKKMLGMVVEAGQGTSLPGDARCVTQHITL